MNWQKELDKNVYLKGKQREYVITFIQTRVIEVLIDEIPDKFASGLTGDELFRLKQSLRSRWLPKN